MLFRDKGHVFMESGTKLTSIGKIDDDTTENKILKMILLYLNKNRVFVIKPFDSSKIKFKLLTGSGLASLPSYKKLITSHFIAKHRK